MITKRQIAAVMTLIDAQAARANVQYALCGGALFAYLDAQYETEDVDFVASGPLLLPSMHPVFPKYEVLGIKIDWMTPKSNPTKAPLLNMMLQTMWWDAQGKPLATAAMALALKLNTGRDKDHTQVKTLCAQGFSDFNLVQALAAQYPNLPDLAPVSVHVPAQKSVQREVRYES